MTTNAKPTTAKSAPATVTSSKLADPKAPAAASAGAKPGTARENAEPPPPKSWAEIKVGSLVIAQETFADGWWEAIVTEVGPDKVTVRWRDYPRQPPISRTKKEVAFLAVAP